MGNRFGPAMHLIAQASGIICLCGIVGSKVYNVKEDNLTPTLTRRDIGLCFVLSKGIVESASAVIFSLKYTGCIRPALLHRK